MGSPGDSLRFAAPMPVLAYDTLGMGRDVVAKAIFTLRTFASILGDRRNNVSSDGGDSGHAGRIETEFSSEEG